MAYCLLFLGLLLIGGSLYGLYRFGSLNWKEKDSVESNPHLSVIKTSVIKTKEDEDLARGLEKLSSAVEQLSRFLEMQSKAKEGYFSHILEEKINFPSPEREDEIEEKRMEKIYRKYQQGSDLLELSEEFKKSKGEVQLILNLMEAKQKKKQSFS